MRTASLMLRRTTLVAALAAFTACSPMTEPPFPNALPYFLAGTSVAVLTLTDKTITDHVVSAATGKDCSTIQYSRDGAYCRPYPEPVTVVREPIYCFKTIGQVECHNAPATYGHNPKPVGTQFTREVAIPASAAPDAEAARTTFR